MRIVRVCRNVALSFDVTLLSIVVDYRITKSSTKSSFTNLLDSSSWHHSCSSLWAHTHRLRIKRHLNEFTHRRIWEYDVALPVRAFRAKNTRPYAPLLIGLIIYRLCKRKKSNIVIFKIKGCVFFSVCVVLDLKVFHANQCLKEIEFVYEMKWNSGSKRKRNETIKLKIYFLSATIMRTFASRQLSYRNQISNYPTKHV